MARLTAVSGLNSKSAAIFLVELDGKRILFDCGDGLEPDEHPDLSGLGKIDAVFLSHAHTDHYGSLHRGREIGLPPIFATRTTFDLLPASHRCGTEHIIPERGHFDFNGLQLATGRSGHAPGGVWFHLETPKGGLIYTGDICLESAALPFDPLPEADSLIIDASYGDRDGALSSQIDAMAQAATGGAVLCCPAAGRGTEMVLAMLAYGHEVFASETIAAEFAAATGRKIAIVDAKSARPDQVIIATDANAEGGLAGKLIEKKGFRFLFSSHVPAGTPAAAMIANGTAGWRPWNVHPRLGDVLTLADATKARRIMPAFVDMTSAPLLRQGLGMRLLLDYETEI